MATIAANMLKHTDQNTNPSQSLNNSCFLGDFKSAQEAVVRCSTQLRANSKLSASSFDILINPNFWIQLTIFPGISGNPWPSEKLWPDVLPPTVIVSEAGNLAVLERVDNASMVRVPVVDLVVENSGSSPVPVVARPKAATSPADGISPSVDAPACRRTKREKQKTEWLAPLNLTMVSQNY